MIKILYETKELVFVVKPRGVASQKSTGNNMVDLLTEQLNSEIFPVHRLDTATGGVMVYAKNKITASELSKAFAENRCDKEYSAVVCGVIPSRGEMTDYLWHDKIKNKSFSVKTERKGAKLAKLSYIKESSNEHFSLVRIKLETGRTHQIRAQFATRGFPLAGDGKYGGRSSYPLMLWCESLSVPNSKIGEILTFTEMPPENEELWKI